MSSSTAFGIPAALRVATSATAQTTQVHADESAPGADFDAFS